LLNFVLVIVWGTLVHLLMPVLVINSAVVEEEGGEIGVRAIRGLRALNNMSIFLLIALNLRWGVKDDEASMLSMAVLLIIMSLGLSVAAFFAWQKKKDC